MSQEAKSFTLESLRVLAKQLAVRKQASKEAAQGAATIRRQEVSDLEWPVDDARHWRAVEIKLIYEQQNCLCCNQNIMCFHQELVGFQSINQEPTMRWLRHRGEALEGDLPTSYETRLILIPECWECRKLRKHLNTLWSLLSKEKEPSQ